MPKSKSTPKTPSPAPENPAEEVRLTKDEYQDLRDAWYMIGELALLFKGTDDGPQHILREIDHKIGAVMEEVDSRSSQDAEEGGAQ